METAQFCNAVSEFSQAVFLQSQIVCATAEIEAMKAENRYRISNGELRSYSEDDFLAVPGKYGLHHNSAFITLKGGS